MKSYFLNPKAKINGDFIVHKEDCHRLPYIAEKKYLGDFTNCYNALQKARQSFSQVNGCMYCSASCHSRD